MLFGLGLAAVPQCRSAAGAGASAKLSTQRCPAPVAGRLFADSESGGSEVLFSSPYDFCVLHASGSARTVFLLQMVENATLQHHVARSCGRQKT